MPPTRDEAGEDDETEGGEEEDYADAVTRHAKYLGIDPERDAAYMWIAEEALNADVPEGWVTGEGEGEYAGLVYYYNEASGESTWDHPLDEYYREKFKKKKAKHAERKKRDGDDKHASRSRTSISPSRASRSTRHNTSDIDKDDDDRSRSKRKSSKRSSRRDKHGSSDLVDEREHNRHGSRHRSASSNRHRDSRQKSRTAGDDVEGSKHRSRSRRHESMDASQMDADERESSRRRRSTSDRHRRDSDGDQALEFKETSEHRPKESGRRSKEGGRDNGASRGRRRSQSPDDTRRNGSRAKGNGSKPASTPEERQRAGRSRRATNDSAGGDNDGIGEERGGTSKARDQSGLESMTRQSEGGELDRKSHTNDETISGPSQSDQENTGTSRSNRQDLDERRRSRSRGTGHNAGNGADRKRKSSDASRKDRRRESGQDVLSRRQDDNNRHGTDFVTLSEDPSAAGDTWRTKSISGNRRGETAESFNARHTTFKEPDFEIGTNVESDVARGGVLGVDQAEEGNPRADTAVEPMGEVIELEEALGETLSLEDSAAPGQVTHGAGPTSEKMRAKRTTTTPLDDNKLEEMDFEDELRDIEDDSDKNSLPGRKTEQSTKLAAPETSAIVRSPSKRPNDIRRSDDPVAAVSFDSPMRTAAANAADHVQRGSHEEEHPDDTSSRKGSRAKTVAASRKNIEDETQVRHRSSSADIRENLHVRTRSKGPVTPAAEISNRDKDEWPEVTEELVGGLKGREKQTDSDRRSSETVHGNRVYSGGRGRERSIDADGISRDDTDQHGFHGNNNDHKRGVSERNRSRDRNVRRDSGQMVSHIERHDGSDRATHGVPADRDRAGANDAALDESPTRVRPNDSYGIAGTSGSHRGEDSNSMYRGGGHGDYRNDFPRGRRCDKFSSHQQHGWHGGETFTAGQRTGRNDDRQDRAGGGVGDWKVERQLLQQQEEASAKTRDLETKVVRLEASLASSTSREDHLRGELADAARREGATREQHARALAEEEKKAASLNDKLSEAVTRAREAVEADGMRIKSEEGLRLQLKSFQEKLEIAEGVLARKKEEDKASARWEADAPNLRLILATREEEVERQGKALVDVQGRLAEATNKVTELSGEVHRTKDLAERLRLEAAESSSRASTSEAALSQAASEMSSLNHALSRAREDLSAKEAEVANSADETNRMRLQLGLEQEKSSNTEDRLQRAKAAFESEVESLRARTVELQSANASMEREMRNSQQDSLSRLRESERDRDAALYEGKRSAELASSADAWRLKETLRADAAENKALATVTEVADLRSQAARLRVSTDAVAAPYAKRNAELQEQLDEARREAAELTAEANRLKATYAAEMATVKEEVARKLPLIAEKAASEAGRYWRKRAEEETTALRTERDNRLRELQIAVSEGEARRQKDVAGARFEAERFRSVAEKLAAENRSIRGELERYLAGEARSSAAASRSSTQIGHSVRVAAGSSSNTFGNGGRKGEREPAGGKAWEGALQAQVLGEVEAHLNVLRAQLKQGTPGINPAVDNNGFVPSAGVTTPCPTDPLQVSRHPAAGTAARVAPAGAVADEENAISSASTGLAPPSMESRGNFHLSPTPQQRSGNGLTEMEDMRLTRLLRSTTSSSSPPVSLHGESIAPLAGQKRAKNSGGNSTIVPPGGIDSFNKDGSLRKGISQRFASVMPDGVDGTEDLYFPEGTNLSGNCEVVCELFGASPEGNSKGVGGNGQARRLGDARARGGYVATRGGRSLAGEDDDDLEDISDGGFHSGCWRRKYVRGDMR